MQVLSASPLKWQRQFLAQFFLAAEERMHSSLKRKSIIHTLVRIRCRTQSSSLNNTCGMPTILVSELRIAPQMSPPQVRESEAAYLSFVTMAFRAERLASAVVVSGYPPYISHLGVVWHVGIHKTWWFNLSQEKWPPLQRTITTVQRRIKKLHHHFVLLHSMQSSAQTTTTFRTREGNYQ